MKIDPRITRDSARMMREPEWWDSWPFLPIKNTRELDDVGFPKCALLVDFSAYGGSLLDIRFLEDANLFMPPSDAQLATCVVADIDQLLRDGWVVD